MARSVKVILLNGVGSVGKSSIAKALQEIAGRPLLHVSMDAFLDMLPASAFGRPEGLVFERLRLQGHPAVAIHSGPLVERALAGMRAAVAALAEAGNDLVVDEVMLGDEPADYARRLTSHQLFTVGLFAPLAVLEARERARGDRQIGLARGQFDRVHAGRRYDLEIDCTVDSPRASAERIAAACGL